MCLPRTRERSALWILHVERRRRRSGVGSRTIRISRLVRCASRFASAVGSRRHDFIGAIAPRRAVVPIAPTSTRHGDALAGELGHEAGDQPAHGEAGDREAAFRPEDRVDAGKQRGGDLLHAGRHLAGLRIRPSPGCPAPAACNRAKGPRCCASSASSCRCRRAAAPAARRVPQMRQTRSPSPTGVVRRVLALSRVSMRAGRGVCFCCHDS